MPQLARTEDDPGWRLHNCSGRCWGLTGREGAKLRSRLACGAWLLTACCMAEWAVCTEAQTRGAEV
jgi:hypothetical protein